MRPKRNNYAFIDAQNIHKGIRGLGWNLDWRKFRVYLKEKYGVDIAYLFIGYMPEYNERYVELQKAGFILNFKPTFADGSGKVKGNVDADLVLQAVIDLGTYEKAVIATSDGDFYSLVGYLDKNGKLETVISPHPERCSALLKKRAKGKMAFMNTLVGKLTAINEKAPPQDET